MLLVRLSVLLSVFIVLFGICTAQDDDEWREHCRGQILIEYQEAKSVVDDGLEDRLLQERSSRSIDEAQKTCTTKVDAQKVYDGWKNVGLVFGPLFQTVSDPALDHGSGKAFAKVNSTIPALKKLMPHQHVPNIRPLSADTSRSLSHKPQRHYRCEVVDFCLKCRTRADASFK